MDDLRAPDPTLTALARSSAPPEGQVDDRVVRVDLATSPAVAHSRYRNIAHGSDDMADLRTCDARWFAVPCRECFPEAPPREHGNAGLPHSHLSWQVPS